MRLPSCDSRGDIPAAVFRRDFPAAWRSSPVAGASGTNAV